MVRLLSDLGGSSGRTGPKKSCAFHGSRFADLGPLPADLGGSVGAVAGLIDGGRCMRFMPGGSDIGSRCVSARARTADRCGFNCK